MKIGKRYKVVSLNNSFSDGWIERDRYGISVFIGEVGEAVNDSILRFDNPGIRQFDCGENGVCNWAFHDDDVEEVE